MIPDFIPSPEAEAEGVCHTEAECAQLYQDIPDELKRRGRDVLLAKLRVDDALVAVLLRREVDKTGDYYDAIAEWCGEPLSVHTVLVVGNFSRQVRNFLREGGCGEDELQVHNLDCVFVGFLKDALSELRSGVPA